MLYTIYIIDDVQYSAENGLDILATAEYANAPVVVLGDLHVHPNYMEAQEVYVGSSVPGGTGDVMNGSVITRSANSITVQGASLVRSSGKLDFCNKVVVALDENTPVSKQFSEDKAYASDISVGQRIMVFGEAGNKDAQGNATMTATAARMLTTHLRGTVNSSSEGLMNMRLEAIDCRKPGAFSFGDAGVDADPNNYIVSPTGSYASGTRVKVWGHVNSYGHSDAADFKAQTVVNISTMLGLMQATWKTSGYEKTFQSISDDGLVLYLPEDKVGRFHYLCRADMVDDLIDDFTDPITITEPDSGTAFFCIAQGLYFRPYTDFANFVDVLNDWTMVQQDVRCVTALGHFNDTNATMAANWLVVRFAP